MTSVHRKRPAEWAPPRILNPAIRVLASTLLIIAAPLGATADDQDLTDLSLEELMSIDVTVTSTARRPQRVGDAAAAVFVLTGEDIRRAGATNIPDALRLVPGVQVARIDANKWAISVRGFNGRVANKLQVLIDGRSVYTPIFAGVFWDRQEVFIEDVERIEVIRGPGASLWGANAVNGVINVVTKPVAETQGGIVSALGGNEEAVVGTRYGAALGDLGHARLYGQFRWQDAGVFADGDAGNDAWHSGRVGFRTDLDLSPEDELTVQGDLFVGSYDDSTIFPTLTPPFSRVDSVDGSYSGGNVLGRWTRTLSQTSHLSVQAYFDVEAGEGELGDITRNTFDIDAEHRFQWGDNHDIVWGGGYRVNFDDFRNNAFTRFDPESRVYDLISFFAQDDITLLPDEVRLTLGTKVEHNAFTGWEVQPTARLLWTPDEDNSLWAAVSRAVRTPTRAEDDATILQSAQSGPMGVPLLLSFQGDRSFDSEELLAFEAGYRVRATEDIAVDIATFYNIYDNLRSIEQGSLQLPTRSAQQFVQTLTIGNQLEGETWGVEVAAEWQVLDNWRLEGSYSFLDMDLRTDPGSTDVTSVGAEDESPMHQAVVRSSVDINDDLDFDLTLRAVDSLGSFDIDGYVELDARLAWRPVEGVELAVVGRNLVNDSHAEFGSDILGLRPTEVERSVFGQLRLSF